MTDRRPATYSYDNRTERVVAVYDYPLPDDTLTCDSCRSQYLPAEGCQDGPYLCPFCLTECPTCAAGIAEQRRSED